MIKQHRIALASTIAICTLLLAGCSGPDPKAKIKQCQELILQNAKSNMPEEIITFEEAEFRDSGNGNEIITVLLSTSEQKDVNYSCFINEGFMSLMVTD
jgi:PBP1b-binding outer membrane lipoprotein LpoB